jgi:uncharacterized protein
VLAIDAFEQCGAPLHGRFAWKASLQPFNYWYCAQMASFRSNRDRIGAYGIFGGTPRYLDALRPTQSLADNAARLMLAPRGEVRGLIETAILQEQGLREMAKYQAIMRSIGNGCTEVNEIAHRSGLPLDTPLRDKIERLIDLGYVSKTRNLAAKSTAPYRYHLSDPAFAFYYAFVSHNEAALERTDPHYFWRHVIEPRFDTYLGHVFERVASQAYEWLQPRLRLPVVREWGRWEGRDRSGKSLEIDIAATLADGRVMTGAVKWNSRPLEAKWHLHHLNALERLAQSGMKWAHSAQEEDSPLLYLAAGGFTREFVNVARAGRRHVYLWTLSDIFKPRARVARGAKP